jgi:toxin ParE1/3/4
VSIKWTKTALRNIDEIAGYISRENPKRATQFVLELIDSTNMLKSHPGMDRAGRVPSTRELVLHKHYIAI